jgi:hypothetical protein
MLLESACGLVGSGWDSWGEGTLLGFIGLRSVGLSDETEFRSFLCPLANLLTEQSTCEPLKPDTTKKT